jgi:hypothetical protein
LTYVQIAAGSAHSLALRSDGQLLTWGYSGGGLPNVPVLQPGLSFARIAAGGWHSLAILSDGTAVAWGDNTHGECNVPVLPQGLSFAAITGGVGFTVALVSDGSILAWGDNSFGACNVPTIPAGLACVEVAAGYWHAQARLSDGSIIGWGVNNSGECNAPALAPGLTYVEAGAGAFFSVARVDALTSSFCFGDGTALACPCANSGTAGRGCENSDSTGGALLSPGGTPSLAADTLHLNSVGEPLHSLSVFLQGTTSIAPVHFGDGLRCTGGSLRRLFVHSALGGAVDAPQGGDLSVSARSFVAGDPLNGGSIRYYQVYYRDPDPGFCPAPAGDKFNISNGTCVTWWP